MTETPIRPLRGQDELRRLLHPASIAVVGASARAGAFGERVAANLGRFAGRVHLVNPRAERIGERPCYPSVGALPEVPDCVVIATPREAVEAVIGECAAAGVGGAVVFASGYSETARPEHVAAQHRLVAIARETGLPIVGPNCLGIVNYAARAWMTFFTPPPQESIRPASIGVVSQSGALGFAMAQAVEHGASVCHLLTSGNSCDVDMADYVAYLAGEPACKAIACMFEGMTEPARLIAAVERASAAGRRVVICKIATGASGAAAALSHTGSLAGSDAAWRAAFARAGAVVVEDFEAVMEAAAFFAKAPAPAAAGKAGIAVLATSGGAAIMAADKADKYEVALPQPAAATRAVLESRIPEYGSARNPCDVTAQVLTDPDSLGVCAGALLEDPAYAALLVPQVFASERVPMRVAQLGALAERTGKLICQVWVNEFLEGPGAREAEQEPHTALFRSMDRCFATLAAWLRPAAAADGATRLAPAGAAERVAAALREAAGRTLGEREAKSLLAQYGIPVIGERLCASAEAAVTAAAGFGGKVALKVESPDLPHKTEAGVIRLGLEGAAAVRAAYDAVMENAARAGARVEGVLVQPMAPAGVEIMVGARIDPLFGPLILVGLGGVLVEVLKDTAVDLAPVTPAQALAMLERLKGRALLDGFRGAPAVDRAALAEVISRLSEFAADQASRVREFDVNPLICAGGAIVAVDALIATAGQESS